MVGFQSVRYEWLCTCHSMAIFLWFGSPRYCVMWVIINCYTLLLYSLINYCIERAGLRYKKYDGLNGIVMIKFNNNNSEFKIYNRKDSHNNENI